MLTANILTLPFVVLLAFSNESKPTWASDVETDSPRAPMQLQPPGRWSTTSWGLCSNPCGAGEERRQVSCVLEDVTSTLIVAADGFCAPPKPTGTRHCYQYRTECANKWVVGDWGPCSARCGGGQRSRLVECHAGPSDAGSPPPSDVSEPRSPGPLSEGQCVEERRPDDRRGCNFQPCRDGRHVWLRTSDTRRPRRMRLFSKFTLRCPFPVFWTPADDRSKRKYAWYKDGLKLPLHDDKYTLTDNRGELRVKGADEMDSGVYTCASLTTNPQGRTHNITVTIKRVPGEPASTTPPEDEHEEDEREDSTETPSSTGLAEAEANNEANTPDAVVFPQPPEGTMPESAEEAQTPPSTSNDDLLTTSQMTTDMEESESTSAMPPPPPLVERRKRDSHGSPHDDSISSSPGGAIEVVAARYDPSAFSECSSSCGHTGLRQRSVRCVDNKTGAQLPLAACEDLGPPPPPQQPCNRIDCPPTWQWPTWRGIKCSRSCGGGSKWRQARCAQTMLDGSEATLEPEQCAYLGQGEERRDCHREPCALKVRVGEIIRLECLAPKATWAHNDSMDAISLANSNKFVHDNEEGILFVFGATPADAGMWFCNETDDAETVSTHRFAVTVLQPVLLPKRSQADDDDLIVLVCQGNATREATTLPSPPPSSEDEVTESVFVQKAPEVNVAVAVADGEDLDSQKTAGPTGPPFPWRLLLTQAAPKRGRILGIFN